MAPKNLKVSRDSVAQLRDQLKKLAELEVLVGFPEDSSAREENLGEPEITNAALGYIHDNGDPDSRIPQREFMKPAMLEVQEPVTNMLMGLARGVLNSRGTDVEAGLHRIGSKVELAIKNKINEGIPPPLADSTVRNRARRGREGAMWELAWRAAGVPPGVDGLAKPLVDTAQMRNAVKYVVRKRKARK